MNRVFYCPKSNGFYRDGINDQIPTGAVQITENDVDALMEAQATGHTIAPGPDGKPIAVPPPSKTLDELRASLIKKVKAEAAKRIDTIAPVWKQMNELRLAKAKRTIDFDQIDKIREDSNSLETKISKFSEDDIGKFDVTDDSNWG